MSVTHTDFTIERHFSCTLRQTFSAFSDPSSSGGGFANPSYWPDAEWELEFSHPSTDVAADSGEVIGLSLVNWGRAGARVKRPTAHVAWPLRDSTCNTCGSSAASRLVRSKRSKTS